MQQPILRWQLLKTKAKIIVFCKVNKIILEDLNNHLLPSLIIIKKKVILENSPSIHFKLILKMDLFALKDHVQVRVKRRKEQAKKTINH